MSSKLRDLVAPTAQKQLRLNASAPQESDLTLREMQGIRQAADTQRRMTTGDLARGLDLASEGDSRGRMVNALLKAKAGNNAYEEQQALRLLENNQRQMQESGTGAVSLQQAVESQDPSQLLSAAAQNLGGAPISLAPQVGAALAVTPLGKYARYIAGAAAGVDQNKGEVLTSMYDDPAAQAAMLADPNKAQNIANTAAMGSALVDLGPGAIAGGITKNAVGAALRGKATNAIGGTLLAGAQEALPEVAQGWNTNRAVNELSGQDNSYFEGWKPAEDAFGGFVQGGGIHAAAHIPTAVVAGANSATVQAGRDALAPSIDAGGKVVRDWAGKAQQFAQTAKTASGIVGEGVKQRAGELTGEAKQFAQNAKTAAGLVNEGGKNLVQRIKDSQLAQDTGSILRDAVRLAKSDATTLAGNAARHLTPTHVENISDLVGHWAKTMQGKESFFPEDTMSSAYAGYANDFISQHGASNEALANMPDKDKHNLGRTLMQADILADYFESQERFDEAATARSLGQSPDVVRDPAVRKFVQDNINDLAIKVSYDTALQYGDNAIDALSSVSDEISTRVASAAQTGATKIAGSKKMQNAQAPAVPLSVWAPIAELIQPEHAKVAGRVQALKTHIGALEALKGFDGNITQDNLPLVLAYNKVSGLMSDPAKFDAIMQVQNVPVIKTAAQNTSILKAAAPDATPDTIQTMAGLVDAHMSTYSKQTKADATSALAEILAEEEGDDSPGSLKRYMDQADDVINHFYEINKIQPGVDENAIEERLKPTRLTGSDHRGTGGSNKADNIETDYEGVDDGAQNAGDTTPVRFKPATTRSSTHRFLHPVGENTATKRILEEQPDAMVVSGRDYFDSIHNYDMSPRNVFLNARKKEENTVLKLQKDIAKKRATGERPEGLQKDIEQLAEADNRFKALDHAVKALATVEMQQLGDRALEEIKSGDKLTSGRSSDVAGFLRRYSGLIESNPATKELATTAGAWVRAKLSGATEAGIDNSAKDAVKGITEALVAESKRRIAKLGYNPDTDYRDLFTATVSQGKDIVDKHNTDEGDNALLQSYRKRSKVYPSSEFQITFKDGDTLRVFSNAIVANTKTASGQQENVEEPRRLRKGLTELLARPDVQKIDMVTKGKGGKPTFVDLKDIHPDTVIDPGTEATPDKPETATTPFEEGTRKTPAIIWREVMPPDVRNKKTSVPVPGHTQRVQKQFRDSELAFRRYIGPEGSPNRAANISKALGTVITKMGDLKAVNKTYSKFKDLTTGDKRVTPAAAIIKMTNGMSEADAATLMKAVVVKQWQEKTLNANQGGALEKSMAKHIMGIANELEAQHKAVVQQWREEHQGGYMSAAEELKAQRKFIGENSTLTKTDKELSDGVINRNYASAQRLFKDGSSIERSLVSDAARPQNDKETISAPVSILVAMNELADFEANSMYREANAIRSFIRKEMVRYFPTDEQDPAGQGGEVEDMSDNERIAGLQSKLEVVKERISAYMRTMKFDEALLRQTVKDGVETQLQLDELMNGEVATRETTARNTGMNSTHYGQQTTEYAKGSKQPTATKQNMRTLPNASKNEGTIFAQVTQQVKAEFAAGDKALLAKYGVTPEQVKVKSPAMRKNIRTEVQERVNAVDRKNLKSAPTIPVTEVKNAPAGTAGVEKRSPGKKPLGNNTSNGVRKSDQSPKKVGKSKKAHQKLTEEIAARREAAFQAVYHIAGDVRVQMRQLHKDLGGSGQYTPSDFQTKALIELAVDAVDPTRVAMHEALHHIWASLKNDRSTRALKARVEKVMGSPQVLQVLFPLMVAHEMENGVTFKKAEQNVANMLTHPEERVAYAFQYWKDSEELQNAVHSADSTNDGTLTRVYKAVTGFLRSLTNTVSENEQVKNMFNAMHEGALADNKTRSTMLKVVAGETAGDMFNQRLGPLAAAFNRMHDTGAERLRNMNIPAITEIANMFYQEVGEQSDSTDFFEEYGRRKGQWTSTLQDIMDSATKEEKMKALTNMQNMAVPKSPLEKAVRDFLDNFYEYQNSVPGLTISRVKNYFPRSWDSAAIRTDKQKFAQLLMQEGKMSAETAMQATIHLATAGGHKDIAENDHHVGYAPFAAGHIARVFDFINAKNAHKFSEFQNQDIEHILEDYVVQSVHRLEYARMFSDNGEVLRDKLKEAQAQGASPEEILEAVEIIRGFEGTLSQNSLTATMKAATTGLITLQNMALLPLSLFSQFIDPLAIGARSGEWSDVGSAYVQYLKDLKKVFTRDKTKGEMQEMAEWLGLMQNDVAAHTMQGMQSSMSTFTRKMNNLYFKANGMQLFNDSMRIAALSAAERYIIKHRGDPQKMHELGITARDVKLRSNGRLDIYGGNEAIQRALYRYVESSVIRPNPGQQSTWMQDPRFALLAHMKRFSYGFEKLLLQRANKEMQGGNVKPYAMLLAGVPVMLAVDMAKWSLFGGSNTAAWSVGDYLTNAFNRSGLAGRSAAYINPLPGGGMGIEVGPTLNNLMRLGRGDVSGAVTHTVPGASIMMNKQTPLPRPKVLK